MRQARLKYALAQSPIVQALRDVATRLERKDSYSQHGEDRFIHETVFKGARTGRYLDIGASHPVRISNTWLLYRMGWSGVTVEPVGRLAEAHRRWRPRDVQVQAIIGAEDGEIDFFNMYPSVRSTCSPEARDEVLTKHGGRLIETIRMRQITIPSLLRDHGLETGLDFLSIDIEGLDQILARQVATLPDRSLPRCVCIEFTGEQARKEIEACLRPRFRNLDAYNVNLIFWN